MFRFTRKIKTRLHEKYNKIKIKSKGGHRELAKRFLNHLYGKIAPSVKEDGFIYVDTDYIDYLQKGFIYAGTGYIDYLQNSFIYAGTDSIDYRHKGGK